jgi:BMFP domain-containing protein YqiC
MKTKRPLSSAPFVATRTPMSRRHFLRGTGVALALPMLDAMLPRFAKAAESSSALAPGAKPRRMFAICNNLGLLPDQFFPKGPGGQNYVLSPYLKHLEAHRNDFTVFSGVSHPSVDGGHPADICFLSGAPHPASSSFRNTISLDQYMAEKIGSQTRYPSITLAVNTRARSLSATSTGVAIPPEDRASDVFKQLFLQGSAEEVQAKIREIDTGRSILDTIAGDAKDLQRSMSARDKERLDQYFTSVRDLEGRLKVTRGWEQKPKPVVKAPVPVDPASPAQFTERVRVMFDLTRLAFENDSTRLVTLLLSSVTTPVVELPDFAIKDGYHDLSHHGNSPDKLVQLRAIEEWHLKLLAKLYTDLKSVNEGGDSLFDRTMVLYGSQFGSAASHVCTNMPVVFGGGGFKHGQHLAFDTEKNYPLTNLFVSMLHRMGLEDEKFSSSTGTMRGLEMT